MVQTIAAVILFAAGLAVGSILAEPGVTRSDLGTVRECSMAAVAIPTGDHDVWVAEVCDVPVWKVREVRQRVSGDPNPLRD